MSDRIMKVSGDWALGTDGVQWMLLRRHKRPGREDSWDGTSFVRSTVDVLARCMRERGVPASDQAALLEGLPTSFAEWIGMQRKPLNDEREVTTYFQIQQNRMVPPGEERVSSDISSLSELPASSPWHHDPVPDEPTVDRTEDAPFFIHNLEE